MRDTNLHLTLTTEHGTATAEQVTPKTHAEHCELCGRPNPTTDDGYTTCCNELTCEGPGCVFIKATSDGRTSVEHYRSREAAIEAYTAEAWDRDETDACEKGTTGCSTRHSATTGIETDCHTW